MNVLIVEDELVIAQRVERFTKKLLGHQLVSLRVELDFEISDRISSK